MKIKFFAKNTGDGDFISSPIKVEYNIINNLFAPSMASGRFNTSNLNIRVGEQVELGEITLPDREKALDSDLILIAISIEPRYRLPLEKDADNYEHRWETKRLIIDNELLSIFGGVLSGAIRINNYGECGGGTLGHSDAPYTQQRQKLTVDTFQCTPGDPYYRANDSYIEIMNNRQKFSIPRFEYTKGWLITYDYKGYVHDLNAKWEGKNAFSISKGKLKLNINFETEGTEVKGFEYTQGMYYDWSASDYDFTKFDFTVYFKFGKRNKKISYLDVEILPEIRGRFEGGYKILPDSIEKDIDEKIKNEISKRLRELLMSDSIRGKIEEAMDSKINSIFIIHRIVDVKTEGDSIVIEYLPK